jgi:hypothetical protein
VRLFPPLDQLVGIERLAVELPEAANGAALIDRLRAQVGDRLPEGYRLVLVADRACVAPEAVLRHGDRVTIIHQRSCCHQRRVDTRRSCMREGMGW